MSAPQPTAMPLSSGDIEVAFAGWRVLFRSDLTTKHALTRRDGNWIRSWPPQKVLRAAEDAARQLHAS